MYIYFTFYSLQLKVAPYMYGTCPLTQHLHNLRRYLKFLGLLRNMASKSEVTRFGLNISLLIPPYIEFLDVVFMGHGFFLQQGYCFGFVAFEMPSSVQIALEVLTRSFLSL